METVPPFHQNSGWVPSEVIVAVVAGSGYFLYFKHTTVTQAADYGSWPRFPGQSLGLERFMHREIAVSSAVLAAAGGLAMRTDCPR